MHLCEFKVCMCTLALVASSTFATSLMFALLAFCTQVARPAESSSKLHSIQKAKNAKFDRNHPG